VSGLIRQDRDMNDLDDAIDAYLDDLSLQRKSENTRRKYRDVLWKFAEHTHPLDCDQLTEAHCRAFLRRWANSSASTLALHVSILTGFFAFLVEQTVIGESPMVNVRRPPRKKPEDIEVVTVSSADVERMFAACQEWDEILCLTLIAYLGPRRGATAKLRRHHLDLDGGYVRFEEKGSKVIVKPIPHELWAVLREAEEAGVWIGPNDYVIPNRRPPKNKERSDKVIYRIVKDVAARARVRSHVHALRAAFAVAYLETVPDATLKGLRDLLGHERYETTEVYLRRLNKQKGMESVRGLSWGSLSERGARTENSMGTPISSSRPRSESDFVFPSSPHVPPTGFEPVFPPSALPAVLERKLAELKGERATTKRIARRPKA
jgi:integrase/recombinase XerD